MKKLLAFTALAEAATGLALILTPSLVGRLLLGAELNGLAGVMARLTGIALLALGVACWPGQTALCGMLTYNALATAYLAWLGIGREWAGPLLWPAVAVHAGLTLLMARAWLALRTPVANTIAKPTPIPDRP